MSSPESSVHLYVVQVRFGFFYREHVASCESYDFFTAKDYAVQLVRWFTRGHCHGLPEDAIALRDELEQQGIPPARCVVEVVRLREVTPGCFATEGDVLCTVVDCTDDEADALEMEDTVIIVDDEPKREFVSVTAERR